MTPLSPVLEDEREDDDEETPEAESEDTEERDGSAKSLDEIIDAYAG